MSDVCNPKDAYESLRELISKANIKALPLGADSGGRWWAQDFAL